ncbi:MAG TPA: hypothetical protein VFF65_13020 [Phycisphaerales bacterium]|nr:hypothetical protein [Phycisphaerales bacterium]
MNDIHCGGERPVSAGSAAIQSCTIQMLGCALERMESVLAIGGEYPPLRGQLVGA